MPAHAITTSRMDAASVPCASRALSVVIPAFQAARTLAASIASVRASVPAGTEIIVVDDGSFDDTFEQASRLADVVVGRPCQGGAARARNDGSRVARGKFLLFVDADVTVNEAAVRGAIAHLEGGADAVFGAYEPLPPPEVRNFATTYKNLLHHYTHLQSAGEADTFWSGFGALRREAFMAVGGFDPLVTTGADVEDIHLGYRLRADGRTIVLDPRLQVQHHKRYTVGGVIRSDVFHRAVPWTRAMLTMRTFHADLNLRRESVGAASVTVATVLTLGSVPWIGAPAVGASALLMAGWFLLHRRLLTYFRRQWTLAGTLGSAAMLFAYYLYGLVGSALGVGAFLLRHERHPRLNWLALDLGAPNPQRTAVTLAIVASPGEPLAALGTLPGPAAWWELIVVATDRSVDLRPDAIFILAPHEASRDERRQLALDVAQGQMFATLDATSVPDPGWLDCVRAGAGRPWVVVAGPFHHDRRNLRHRAAQIVRFWGWRPEIGASWIVNHPSNNAAFRTDVARWLGGFRTEGALLLRMAGFGARPVRFLPEMGVRLAGPPLTVPFLRGVGGTARLRASATTRYHDITRLHRLSLVAASPALATHQLARIVRDSVRERHADPMFWSALPLVTLGLAAHCAGRSLGLLRPAKRGGLVPRSEDDLALLVENLPRASAG